MTNRFILCIAFGNAHLTKAAVTSFLAQDVPCRVVLINNASRDNTAAWMATLPDSVLQVHFSAQRSVAACWNFGLDWCFRNGAESVLVANNDVELRPETYRLLEADGGPFVTAVGVNTKEQAQEALEPEKRRDHPDFSCFMIRKDTFQRVRFDEAYEGAYAEDAAFHLSMFRAGIPAYCIGLPFYHVASGSMKYSDEEAQERIRFYADRNRKLFKDRHGADVGSPEYYALFSNPVL